MQDADVNHFMQFMMKIISEMQAQLELIGKDIRTMRYIAEQNEQKK